MHRTKKQNKCQSENCLNQTIEDSNPLVKIKITHPLES